VSADPVCHVLREDAELGECVDPRRRAQATEECITRVMSLPSGRSSSDGLMLPQGGIGLLVLEGLLIRRVGIEGRFGAELLGEGDLLRPWQDERDTHTLPLQTGWTVANSTRLAWLDEDFIRHLSKYPELAITLVARAMQRSRHLAVNMAIVHQARVDVRLHMLFWHLAGRWGRVRRDATVVPLRLTHAVLSDLVAARRPTVTSALSDLARRGLVRFSGEEWLLSGDAPAELLDLNGLSTGTRRTTHL